MPSRAPPPGRASKLTLVHKTNVLTHAGSSVVAHGRRGRGRTSRRRGRLRPRRRRCLYFVTQPQRFDVIVTDNLFGDIITDLGAAIAGGIGLAASGNLNLDGTAPSMFEPVHGSAPDIAGQGIADPTATVLSVAMLLDHLGHSDAAARVEAAVAADLAQRSAASAPAAAAAPQRSATHCACRSGLTRTLPVWGCSSTVEANPTPATDERVAEVLRAPGFGARLHRPPRHRRWTARARLA